MSEAGQQIFSEAVVRDVRSSWSLIRHDLHQVGVEIFQNLLEVHPDYQNLFNGFKDVAKQNLRENPAFNRHVLAVAKALNSCIENLDNPKELVAILDRVGKSHAKKNISSEKFLETQKVIHETILGMLGSETSNQVQSAWKEILDVAVSVIMKANEQFLS